MCPVCGKMMVLRRRRTGDSITGQLYYGCIDNPTCQGTVPVK
jgi:ssDNA-binding Zn-finger/Zn-ribbon topoisomerase 1